MPKIATLDEFWNDAKLGVYNFTKDGNKSNKALYKAKTHQACKKF